MKVSVPTAVVLAVFIVGWVVLAALGKPIPMWMTAAAAIVGKVILSLMDSLVSTGGGGTATGASKPVSAIGGGPMPPAAARLKTGLYRLTGAGIVAVFLSGCVNGQPTPQTVQDVTIGLNAAMCILTTYATDIQSKKTEAQAIADAAIKCGVSVIQATGVLDSHRKAEALEAAK